MELSKLIKYLCKVDTIVDSRYADYRDTREKYGDSKMLVDFYKKKYMKAKLYRESLKRRIFELEQITKPSAVEPTKPKRKLIIDEEDDDEPPAKVAKPSATNVRVLNTYTRTDVYTPRKEILTSAYGLKYRHDPDFREHVKNKQRERYERRKFLYV